MFIGGPCDSAELATFNRAVFVIGEADVWRGLNRTELDPNGYLRESLVRQIVIVQYIVTRDKPAKAA